MIWCWFMLFITRYSPSPFTPCLVLLLVHPIASVAIDSLCYLCHGEVLPPSIALCKWRNSFTIKKKMQK